MLRARGGAAVLALCVALGLGAAACSSGTSETSAPPSTARYTVGELHETYVDPTRSTPANGPVPGHRDRTLDTTIFYPKAVQSGAVVRGPFPLIVFAHGFGADPRLSGYQPILRQWAAAGFVVAAPLFPITNSQTPGGPNLSDYVHQPGDMSFVVTQVIDTSTHVPGPLHGLVDASEVGAAGHSLGGVTTLGLIANTCCHDDRIKAAIVMSGDQITFPTGATDYAQAPPVLFVHGNADPTVPYASSVMAFNQAHPPKGLLTVKGGNHDSPVNARSRAFSSIVRVTVEFWDAYLRHDQHALAVLRGQASPGHAGAGGVTFDSPQVKLVFVAKASASVSLPVPTEAVGTLHATVQPDAGLIDGQTVAVSWKGYTPGTSVNVLQCSTSPPTQASECDLKSAKVLVPDPTGSGTTSLVVHTGAIGSGTCDAQHPGCVVVVNQGGSLQASATVERPISFAP